MRTRAVVSLVVVATLLSACSPDSRMRVATIVDDGDGPVLCDEIQTSYPPSCVDGQPVEEWDWSVVAHHEQDGVRWGEYSLTVTPAGDRVSVHLAATPVDDGA